MREKYLYASLWALLCGLLIADTLWQQHKDIKMLKALENHDIAPYYVIENRLLFGCSSYPSKWIPLKAQAEKPFENHTIQVSGCYPAGKQTTPPTPTPEK